MEIKKIVEGMTATEVAQVIDDNFKAAEADKANKKDVDASIAKLTETVETNKTETDAKIDSNKEETDAKLSELGSEMIDNRLNTIGAYEVVGLMVVPKQNNRFKLLLKEGEYTYTGKGNASGAVFLKYEDGTELSINQGMGTEPNNPIRFEAEKKIVELRIYVSNDSTDYGFEITKDGSLSEKIENNDSAIQEIGEMAESHDLLINTRIVKGGECEIVKILSDTAMDNGSIFALSGWTTFIAVAKAGTTIKFYVDGVLKNLRYGLYTSEPKGGSTTDVANNSANSVNIPSDQDYYVAVSDSNLTSVVIRFENEDSIIGNVEKLNKTVLSEVEFIPTETVSGKYLDHNNGYIGTGDGWTIGIATASSGTNLKFYADGVLSSCRYALYNNDTSMSNWTGISGGGSSEIEIPSDRDYIVVICLHNNVSEFSIESTSIGLDRRVEELEGSSNGNATKHKVLWLGTSIPAYSHYPEKVCEILKHECHNVAIGSSGIVLRGGFLNSDRDGKDLSESAEEKEIRYRPYVENGTITEYQLNTYKTYGYDARIIPYIDGTIDSCDVVVIDHGYNDRDTDAMQNFIDNFDSLDMSIDGSDYDRTNFIGAFRFILNKILAVNPNIKIVVCSYLENKTGSEEFPKPTWDSSVIYNSGYQICTLLKKIAEHYNFPYLNMCDYNGFTMEYIPNTSGYLASVNPSYTLKRYTSRPNNGNNVTRFQYYCPDGIHPHTDTSGRSVEVIVSSLTKLMRDI